MRVKLKKIISLYEDINELPKKINEFQKEYILSQKKAKLLSIYMKNLLTDNGIINTLNTYYCQDSIIDKEFCEWTINNAINPLNLISSWKMNYPIWKYLSENITRELESKFTEDDDLEVNLAANYINNIDNYVKIIGKKVIIDFNKYKGIVDRPQQNWLEGTIIKYENPFFFFLVSSFIIDFSNLSDEEFVQVLLMESENNYICWKTDKPKVYNIVLWNGSNDGLRFKFNDSIADLGIKRDNIVDNIPDKLLEPSLSNENKAYLEFTINQAIYTSHLVAKPINQDNFSQIVNIVNEQLEGNSIFYFQFANIVIFMKMEVENPNIINKYNYKQHDINFETNFINNTENWFKKNNIQFDSLINKCFNKLPWTWSLIIKPKLLAFRVGKYFFNQSELTNLLGSSLETSYFPYFAWQVHNLSERWDIPNISSKLDAENEINRFISRIKIKNSKDFYKKIHPRSKKIKFTSNFKKYLTKYYVLSPGSINNLQKCKLESNNGNLYSVLEKVKTKKIYQYLSNKSEIFGLIDIANSTKNFDLKVMLYLLLIEKVTDEIVEFREDIQGEMELWNHMQSVLNSQLSLNSISEKKKLDYKSNSNLRQKFTQIKEVFDKLNCK